MNLIYLFCNPFYKILIFIFAGLIFYGLVTFENDFIKAILIMMIFVLFLQLSSTECIFGKNKGEKKYKILPRYPPEMMLMCAGGVFLLFLNENYNVILLPLMMLFIIGSIISQSSEKKSFCEYILFDKISYDKITNKFLFYSEGLQLEFTKK